MTLKIGYGKGVWFAYNATRLVMTVASTPRTAAGRFFGWTITRPDVFAPEGRPHRTFRIRGRRPARLTRKAA